MKISLLINVSDGTSALPFILDPDFPTFSSSSRMPMRIGRKAQSLLIGQLIQA